MNEKYLKRLKYIRDFAHDEGITIRAERGCGKTIPSLQSVQTLFLFVEDLAGMILDERQ